jgi:hypothetical protein
MSILRVNRLLPIGDGHSLRERFARQKAIRLYQAGKAEHRRVAKTRSGMTLGGIGERGLTAVLHEAN